MRRVLLFATLLAIAAVAGAQDLGNRAPVKMPGKAPANVAAAQRQGGDSIYSATLIPGLPYGDTGTTVGYNDDYSSTCVLAAGAPDVVYRLTAPPGAGAIDVSLCGSTYDTGLYVYDAGLNEIACNDDYCGLQSQLDCVLVTGGGTYYIVVDGYAAASGDYDLHVDVHVGYLLNCPVASNPREGEPPLHDGYVDDWNGGCNTPPAYPFQHIAGALPGSDLPPGHAVFCGVSGWYLSDGASFRDTDWFTLTKAADGVPIEITADAESATYIFELSPRDCANVAVAQQAATAPCGGETFMSIGGAAGPVWFWVGPTVFANPGIYGSTYDYVVWFTGLAPEVVGVDAATWSRVKALYR